MKHDATEIQFIEATQSTRRIDLYSDIHKALRMWMFNTVQRLGQMDASDEQDCSETIAELMHLLDVMQGHLETENAFVHTAIEARLPGWLGDFVREHAEHEREIAALRQKAQHVLASKGEARVVGALALYREFAQFVAENLHHMHAEETLNNQLLWSAYSDEELGGIHGAILASIAPEKMMAIMRWMIPALTPQARAGMLGAMRSNAPAEAFEGVLDLAQARLSTPNWIKLTLALNLPQVPGLVNFSQP